MPTAIVDGIRTHYQVFGDGPPLLMYSPGGFDASLNKWSTLGVYARTRLLDHMQEKFQCIVFDRRETGQSGGRVERITWDDYVEQGKGLLDYLGIGSAHLMGGCMGCCPVAAFAVKYAGMARSIILYWPVGGAGFRLKGHARFAAHLALVEQEGLAGVVDAARKSEAGFGRDPRIGPWAPVIRRDPQFAEMYAAMDVDQYKLLIAAIPRTLLDRDTAPGAEPEDLMRLDLPSLIVPGKDAVHATSAARYLEECLPGAEYWDLLPAEQTEDNVPPRLIEFLERMD